MRRRLNLLLTLSFLMLVLLCGAGAYFTDQQQASIRAAAASMGLTVSKPAYGTIPKEIGKDSRLTVQFQREPTVTEIAAEIGAKREDVVVALVKAHS